MKCYKIIILTNLVNKYQELTKYNHFCLLYHIEKRKPKPIRIITSYHRKNFKQIRHVSKKIFDVLYWHHYQPEWLKSCSIKSYSTIS